MSSRWAFVLILASIVGCSAEGPQLVPVSGRVLVDGQPVANLRVHFAPIGSPDKPYPGPQSIAVTDAEGRYVLASMKDKAPGAVVGPCKVRIQVREEVPESFEAARTRVVKLLPPRFNDQTELKFDVPAKGTESANFDVSWK